MIIFIPRLRRKNLKPGQNPNDLNPTFLSAFAYFFYFLSGVLVLGMEEKNQEVRRHAWTSILLSWYGFLWAVLIVLLGIVMPTDALSTAFGKILAPEILVVAITSGVCFWRAVFGLQTNVPFVSERAKARITKATKNSWNQ